MRKFIYAFGVTFFLAFLIFHVTTSLTTPFFGVSVEALAYGSGSGGSGGNGPPFCMAGGCWARSCEFEGEIAGSGVTVKVTCDPGYYACCHVTAFCFEAERCND